MEHCSLTFPGVAHRGIAGKPSSESPKKYRGLGSILTTRTILQSFNEILVFYLPHSTRVEINGYEPPLPSKITAHPAQNRHYNSNAHGSHPRNCPTGVGLARRQVSVPWGVGVKFIPKSLRYNTKRDKSLIVLSELVRSAALVRSLCQLDVESSETY